MFLFLFTTIQFAVCQSHGYLLPSNNHQWQYSNTGKNGNIDTDIDLPDAWKITTGGITYHADEIVIAIIDNGVNINHPDLNENIWINVNEIPNNGIDDDLNGYIDDTMGWNFKENNNDISNEGYGNWHGTPINGIIGANGDNSIGVSGINKHVKLLNLVRGDDTNSLFNCYKYIYELRKVYNLTNGEFGAFIVAINSSWGQDSIFACNNSYWCDWFQKLGEIGILSVVSAPNENTNIDVFGDMPSNCSSDYIISVTNIEHHDKKVLLAGYGLINVDIAAPGEYSYTTLNNGNYGYFGGTSAAAAYVTGTIGLLCSIKSEKLSKGLKNNSSETALLIKQSIIEGVKKIDNLSNITMSGGKLNVYNSMRYLCDFFDEQYLLSQLEYSQKLIAVYPNPIKDNLVLAIELSQCSIPSITIFNMRGRKVYYYEYPIYPQGIHFLQVDMEGVEQGNYIVQLNLNNQIFTSKILKQ